MVRISNRSEAQLREVRERLHAERQAVHNSIPHRGRVYDRRALGEYVDLICVFGESTKAAWFQVAANWGEDHARWCAEVCGDR